MFDHFNLLAPIYERLIPLSDTDVLITLLELSPEHLLLDAAGGTGRVSGALASSASRVVVCDTSSNMLRYARQRGLETVQAELETLPFPDATFDRILLVDAFHHMRDQAAALRELLRVLKPSGRLVIEEPDIRWLAIKVVAALEKLGLMRSHFVEPHEMVRLVEAQGGVATLAREGFRRVWITCTTGNGEAAPQSAMLVNSELSPP